MKLVRWGSCHAARFSSARKMNAKPCCANPSVSAVRPGNSVGAMAKPSAACSISSPDTTRNGQRDIVHAPEALPRDARQKGFARQLGALATRRETETPLPLPQGAVERPPIVARQLRDDA